MNQTVSWRGTTKLKSTVICPPLYLHFYCQRVERYKSPDFRHTLLINEEPLSVLYKTQLLIEPPNTDHIQSSDVLHWLEQYKASQGHGQSNGSLS